MNYIVFLAIMILVLCGRLRLTFRDEGATMADLIIIALLPLLSLILFTINLTWVLLAVFIILMAIVLWISEKNSKHRNLWRIITLLVYVVGIGLLSSPLLQLKLNALPSNLIQFFDEVFMPDSEFRLQILFRAQLYLFGLLLVLNEMNFLLRYLLHLLQLEPIQSTPEFTEHQVDEKEYNTGRVIGMLERIFVFIFVLFGQYTAIGFILAAKGVARFREFEKRTFAEYVLIGTFLSTLLAMFIALIIKIVGSL